MANNRLCISRVLAIGWATERGKIVVGQVFLAVYRNNMISLDDLMY